MSKIIQKTVQDVQSIKGLDRKQALESITSLIDGVNQEQDVDEQIIMLHVDSKQMKRLSRDKNFINSLTQKSNKLKTIILFDEEKRRQKQVYPRQSHKPINPDIKLN